MKISARKGTGSLIGLKQETQSDSNGSVSPLSSQRTRPFGTFSGRNSTTMVSCAQLLVCTDSVKLLLTCLTQYGITVFALVTVSGSLVVYDRRIAIKALAKVAAHNGDASCLDFHPTQPFIIATGGANDNRVNGMYSVVVLVLRMRHEQNCSTQFVMNLQTVWDLESSITMKKADSNVHANANTMNTAKSETSGNSVSSNDTDRSLYV